jgi:hypothetical protein
MRASILADIFCRVQVNAAERLVLDAILSKTNIYGKHAKIAHEVIQAITGLARSTVYAAIARLEKIRHLLRVERKVLWPGHNAINIYHVVIPWRADPMYDERKRMGWGRKNNKGPGRPDPHTKQEEKSPAHAAHMCSEPVSAKAASAYLTTGSDPWYYAQGLTPPSENGKTGNEG